MCVMAFCVGDGPPGISQERGLYSTLHKHSQRSTGESSSQSVPGLKAKASPPPRHNDDPHTHTHGHACKLHICSKAYRKMLPHTRAHTHAQVWPLSPSHTQLSSVPSLCLFMATPVLIPSHSISITSANSPSSPARTVFLLPFRLHLHPLSVVFCLLQPASGVI